MAKSVITRFAPSPTGLLHIGGARTALFNWAYARKLGGRFLLRIEDTDIARTSQAASAAILDGLSWLGLNWDGEPIYQSQNAPRHQAIAEQLLKADKAYVGDAQAPDGNNDSNGAIRLRTPQTGHTVIHDLVQGDIKIPNDTIEDFVLLRSDKTPTYMLSVVVDDHDMGITHIVRGDDHLTNAAKQKLLYAALGWDMPICAHVPMILDADGKKLSKRAGAADLRSLRTQGYLPEAIRNYLARLGWAHGDTEIFTDAQFLKWFELADIGRSPARLDDARLQALNARYLQQCPPARLLKLLEPHMPKLSGAQQTRLKRALPALAVRANTLPAFAQYAAVLFRERPIALDEVVRAKLTNTRLAHLQAYQSKLSALPDWTEAAIGKSLDAYLKSQQIKMGDIAPALRVAVSGMAGGLNLATLLYALGKSETLSRINDLITK